MCEALNYFGQRARSERNMIIINSVRMTVRDNTIFSDFGRTSFTGASQFLKIMFYEAVIIGADKDAILLYYNSLVNQKSFVTK